MRKRAKQTEAEALPLQEKALSPRNKFVLPRLLANANLILAFVAATPGTHTLSLTTTTENRSSSCAGVFWAIASVSLVITASKFLVKHVAAIVTDIPELPEPTATAATEFVKAIAVGYLLVHRPRLDTEEAVEVIDETTRADERWEPFLRDIAAREFTQWKTELISDRHIESGLRRAILSLYARLQAPLELGKRQQEFIAFLSANPLGQDIHSRQCATADKEANDWTGSIERL